MYELPIEVLSREEALFPGAKLNMVIQSILSGNTGGRLWSLDQNDSSRLLMLWDQGNSVFYLAGNDASEAALTDLISTVADQVRPAALAMRAVYFSARVLSTPLQPLLEQAFGVYQVRQSEKRFYHYPQASSTNDWPIVGEPVAFHLIDGPFLNKGLANTDAIMGEIRWMWPSLERFLTDGWGIAATVGDTVACWCTAEYVSAHLCGIGIETVESFQKRGIATATAAHFVAEALRRGCVPHWECDLRNTPSVHLADKLGFELLETHSFLIGRFQ